VHAAVLPRLDPLASVDPGVAAFAASLQRDGFGGEIRTDYATRLSAATDNSIYQLLPAAVVFPRSTADVALALRLIDEPRFHGVALTARGGGTGTNGQALTAGIVMDLSRHMAKILTLDLAAGFVRVQPGVVLDDLNAFLRPHGVYFAANLSPSNRATLGGMVATDASGEGSRRHGKTSQHVLDLEVALRGGVVHRTARVEGAGPLTVLLKVYVPLAKPVYIAYGLVSVSYHWNNFLWPLIVTNSVNTRPLTVGLQIFASTDQGIDWSVITAATLMTSAPLLVAFLLFQRQFVQSFMRAGIR